MGEAECGDIQYTMSSTGRCERMIHIILIDHMHGTLQYTLFGNQKGELIRMCRKEPMENSGMRWMHEKRKGHTVIHIPSLFDDILALHPD